MSTEKGTPTTDATIELLGGLVDRETIQEIAAAEEKSNAEAEKKTPPAKKPEVKKPVDQEAELEEDHEEEDIEEEEEEGDKGVKKGASKAGKDDEGNEEEEESEEEEGPDPLPENKFGFKGKQKEKKVKALKIETFDELPEVIKSKYGQQLKSAKDLPKFFESVDKWRTAAQNFDKLSKDAEKLKQEKDNAIAVFENLPTDLLDAAKAFYAGQDYKKVFDGKSTLDFSKEKHSTKTLVNHYFPGEFSDDDFEAEEKPKDLKIAEKAALDKYNTEKTSRETRAKADVERAAQKNKAFLASVKSSVESLKKDFPDMTADVVEDISSTLSGNSLLSKFYNSDGTLKQNAAKMLALAEHGEEFISQLIEIAQRQGESRANEEIVDRARKKSSKDKGSNRGQEPPRKEVTDKIKDLLPDGVVGKRTF